MLAANHAAGHHSNGGICGQPIAGQLAQRLLESRRTASELGGAVGAGALGQRFAGVVHQECAQGGTAPVQRDQAG